MLVVYSCKDYIKQKQQNYEYNKKIHQLGRAEG